MNSENCHANAIMSNLRLAVKMKNLLKSVHLSVSIVSAHCNDNETKLGLKIAVNYKGNKSEGEKHKSCVMGTSETGGD